MVFFNYATMQMAAKIVYYGPGLCGKTTNLHHIYTKTSPQSRGEMVSLETETDRTLFFDLLPIDVGVIGGFKTRLQLYTVPGQVFYNTTRKLVLKGVDGIVFVADSQQAMLEANVDSIRNLRENLAEIGLNLDEIPVVLQLNKRDLPSIASIEDMLNALDPERRFEYVEAVAFTGIGVFETLKVISKSTLRTLRRRMTGDEPVRTTTTPRGNHVRVQAGGTSAGNVPVPAVAAAPVEAAAFTPSAVLAEAIAEEVPAEVFVAAPVTVEAPIAAPPPEPQPVVEAKAPEPEIDFGQTEKPQKSEPEVKTVKVRNSIDIMAELEALRKKATTPTTGTPPPAPKPRREITLADLSLPKPRRDMQRSAHLTIPPDLLPRAKSVRVTLSFEDGEQGVLDTRDQKIELGDTSGVDSLSVNLKIDLA
jgi:signal recognition particle receptor subunit beta